MAILGLIYGRKMARLLFGEASGLPGDDAFRSRLIRYGLITQAIGLAGAWSVAAGSAGSLSAYLASGRFEHRLDPSSGTLVILGIYLTPFLSTAPLLMTLSKSGKVRLVGIVFGLASAMAFFFFLKGTRSMSIGLLIGLVVLIAIHRSGHRDFTPTGHRNLAAIVLAGIAAAVILPNMYDARKVLSTEEVSAQEVIFGSTEAEDDPGGTFNQEPLDYSLHLQSAITTFPEYHEYLWLYPLRRLVFFPLKSSPDGHKPPDTNKSFATAIGKGYRSTTIPPSLPGEGYVTLGGLVGSGLWAVLYGLALGWIEARLQRPAVALAAITIGFSGALLALRGQFYELFLSMAATMLICSVVIRLVRPKRARTTRRVSSRQGSGQRP